MTRFAFVVVASLVAVSGWGCDEDSDPRSGPEAQQEIAETVNAMLEQTRAGDGDSACALMTSRGQGLFVKVVRRELDQDPGSCEAAVIAFAEAVSGRGGDRAPPPTVEVHDVSIEPDDDRPEVSADPPYRGAIFASSVDGEWLLDSPFFFD